MNRVKTINEAIEQLISKLFINEIKPVLPALSNDEAPLCYQLISVCHHPAQQKVYCYGQGKIIIRYGFYTSDLFPHHQHSKTEDGILWVTSPWQLINTAEQVTYRQEKEAFFQFRLHLASESYPAEIELNKQGGFYNGQ